MTTDLVYTIPIILWEFCVGCGDYIMHHMVTRKGTVKSTTKPW